MDEDFNLIKTHHDASIKFSLSRNSESIALEFLENISLLLFVNVDHIRNNCMDMVTTITRLLRVKGFLKLVKYKCIIIYLLLIMYVFASSYAFHIDFI